MLRLSTSWSRQLTRNFFFLQHSWLFMQLLCGWMGEICPKVRWIRIEQTPLNHINGKKGKLRFQDCKSSCRLVELWKMVDHSLMLLSRYIDIVRFLHQAAHLWRKAAEEERKMIKRVWTSDDFKFLPLCIRMKLCPFPPSPPILEESAV